MWHVHECHGGVWRTDVARLIKLMDHEWMNMCSLLLLKGSVLGSLQVLVTWMKPRLIAELRAGES